jgi:hypothetical protein
VFCLVIPWAASSAKNVPNALAYTLDMQLHGVPVFHDSCMSLR